jgi:hypothetical protein
MTFPSCGPSPSSTPIKSPSDHWSGKTSLGGAWHNAGAKALLDISQLESRTASGYSNRNQASAQRVMFYMCSGIFNEYTHTKSYKCVLNPQENRSLPVCAILFCLAKARFTLAICLEKHIGSGQVHLVHRLAHHQMSTPNPRHGAVSDGHALKQI